MEFTEFIDRWMGKGKRLEVPARVQSALALLERVREFPSLNLTDHLASAGSSGLESHETWGKKAHARFKIREAINKNHGRRSSSLGDWGQELLDILRDAGFESASRSKRLTIINKAQRALAAILRRILDEDPFQVRLKSRSAEAVIREILEQADGKGKSGDVAQYLVGAKLMLRLGIELPVHAANKGDRRARGDRKARLGDFDIADAIIEVAIGLPDEKHIGQMVHVLEDTDQEVWLLTRKQRVRAWQDEVENAEGIDPKRIIVHSIDGFVGQNMTEAGNFTASGRATKLEELFSLYNDRWIDRVGVPGMRIEVIK